MSLSSVQSNGLPRPPGRVASLGGARVEHQPVGDLAYCRIGDRSARSAIGSAFITGKPKRVRTATTRSGVSLAVQLQHVGLERCDDVEQGLVIGVDGERDLAGAALHALPERARGLQPEMARARRKEHEADQIGPGIKRHIKRLRGLQAADFDRQRHYDARSSAFSVRPQSGTAGLS